MKAFHLVDPLAALRAESKVVHWADSKAVTLVARLDEHLVAYLVGQTER